MHQGKIFKRIVKESDLTVKEVAQKLGVSVPQIFLLYRMEKIKQATLLLICEEFRFDMRLFKDDGEEVEPVKERIPHQGALLDKLIRERGR